MESSSDAQVIAKVARRNCQTDLTPEEKLGRKSTKSLRRVEGQSKLGRNETLQKSSQREHKHCRGGKGKLDKPSPGQSWQTNPQKFVRPALDWEKLTWGEGSHLEDLSGFTIQRNP